MGQYFTNITQEEEDRIFGAYRACGDVICEKCGKKFYQHPTYKPSAVTTEEGHAWLHEICNGDLVKL
jgi:hypothetical protein